jgi:predicted permease
MRWRSREREGDLEREIRADLELEAAERVAEGLSPEQARFAAQRAFGNASLVKEDVRQMWSWTGWGIFLQDLRYGWRSLRRSPGFGATAILTLALGIGASTAIFTVVDSVILKPLAYPDSDRLVVAWERVRFLPDGPVGPNPRHADLWRQRADAFSGITLMQYRGVGVTVGDEHPRLTGGVMAQPNFFDVLQVQPIRGRAFNSEDGVEGHDKVAMVTYPLWQSLFHGDPGAIGRWIRVEGTPRQVIGVLPASFHFPNANALRAFRTKQPVKGVQEPALFFPAVLNPADFNWNGDYGNWIALGRLKRGVAVTAAEAQLIAIEEQIVKSWPAELRAGALLASVQPMQEAVVGESRSGLWLLMAAVIGLMLIACLNLANAQFGRALARRREAAIRTALGAAKWRLVWNVLAENLMVSAIGGAAGVLLAWYGLDFFRLNSPVDLPRLSEIRLNVSVLLFALGLTFAASLLSGLLPALRLLGANPQGSLQEAGRGALGSRQSNRLRGILIGLQVFGCTVLLLVTGLFSKSLLYLLRQDTGLETRQVAVAEVRLTGKVYEDNLRRAAFDDGVLAKLRTIPGVRDAGLVSAMPLEGEAWIEYAQRVDTPDREGPVINLRWASPGYFESTGQKLVGGRFLEERDRKLKSVILSDGEARALWGNENPIGGQVRIRGEVRTVIGVVADAHNTSLKSAPARMAYLDYLDQPPYATFFVVRSAGAADQLLASMRQAIWRYEPDITISRVKTLDAQVTDSVAPERFQTTVLMAFGGAALLLAMLGIYGVLSYSMATRRQEIGMRMALGATRGSVYALTFKEAGVPVAAGLAAGLLVNLFAGTLIRKLLYGIQVVDPAVILLVTGLFLLSAAAAAFLPARRAASVDPMTALRSE